MKREDVLDQLEKLFKRVENGSDYVWRLSDNGVVSYEEFKALETVIRWLRDFPEWIYDNSGIGSTWLYGEIDEIEKVLGFRLFFWQKYYMVYQYFRCYGETTAKNLTELITYRDKEPLDFRKKASTGKERHEQYDLLRLKKKLDDGGIRTREVLLPEGKDINKLGPFDHYFHILHTEYNQIKEESPKDNVNMVYQGKMNLIILEELKKRGIHVTEENAVAWSKRITIVDAGGFGKEYHNFYVYLNKEWEFTIKRTCNASPDCSGYLQTCTYAYEVSDELPPEGTTL